MAMRARLDYDPISGMETVFHTDNDGMITIEERFDAEPTIDANRELFNSRDRSFKGDLNHHIASIPLPIYYDLNRKGIVQDRKAFMKWLMDSDNRAFLTKPARLA